MVSILEIMVKHWPLRKGFANFNNEMVKSYKIPHLKLDRWYGTLGKCIMFEVQWFHTRFYIGWYYHSNKD
jgi:hypothetical protein